MNKFSVLFVTDSREKMEKDVEPVCEMFGACYICRKIANNHVFVDEIGFVDKESLLEAVDLLVLKDEPRILQVTITIK